MLRALLPKIELIRQSRLLSISRKENKDLLIENSPPRKSNGLYWIYTDYEIQSLKKCVSSEEKGAIDIAFRASLHEGLTHISQIKVNRFWLVYNGKSGKSCGLRERLHQHFNGGNGTGCLSVLNSSLNDLRRWRISYVTLEVPKDQNLDITLDYNKYTYDLERIWRLQYGWPLLCIK